MSDRRYIKLPFGLQLVIDWHKGRHKYIFIENRRKTFAVGLQWPLFWCPYSHTYYDGDLYAIHLGPFWINW